MAKEIYDLKVYLAAALKAYHLDDTIAKSQVEEAYRQTVGELIVKLTRSVHYNIERSTLYITLASPALKHELTLKTTDLLNAINAKLPKSVVKKIVYL